MKRKDFLQKGLVTGALLGTSAWASAAGDANRIAAPDHMSQDDNQK